MSFPLIEDIRYSSVALIKALPITYLSPKFFSKSTLCNTLDLVPKLLSQSHPVTMWAFKRFRHCFSPRVFANSWIGRYYVVVPVSVFMYRCLNFIIKNIVQYPWSSTNTSVAFVNTTNESYSNLKTSINEELSSYLYPSSVEVMVAES